MDEPVWCPSCNSEMRDWNMGIYECDDCGNMVDLEAADNRNEEEDI